MIEFNPRGYRHTNNGVVLTKKDVDTLCEDILTDYNTDVLNIPQKVDYEDFMLNYLDVNDVDFQEIYSDKGLILGCALFNEQDLPVVNHNGSNITNYYDERTVVLNRVLLNERKHQELFTALHEAGHIWIHWRFLHQDSNQTALSLCNLANIACKSEYIDHIEYVSRNKELMWRERQANWFATSIGLPNKSLRVAMADIFRELGVENNQLIIDEDISTKRIAMEIIPQKLKDIYGMSKESIIYRLTDLEYYTTKIKYEKDHAQLSLFDFYHIDTN